MKPELGFCIDLARVFAPLSLASVYVLLQSLEGGWMAYLFAGISARCVMYTSINALCLLVLGAAGMVILQLL